MLTFCTSSTGSWKIKPLKINPDERRRSSGKQPISSHNTLRSKRFRLYVFCFLLSPHFARILNTENCILVQKTSRKRLLLRLPQQWISKTDNTSNVTRQRVNLNFLSYKETVWPNREFNWYLWTFRKKITLLLCVCFHICQEFIKIYLPI